MVMTNVLDPTLKNTGFATTYSLALHPLPSVTRHPLPGFSWHTHVCVPAGRKKAVLVRPSSEQSLSFPYVCM